MTKFGIVLAALFVVIGFFYAYLSSRAEADNARRAKIEAEWREKVPLIYALRDVPEGAVFRQGDIGIVMVERSKIPQGVLSKGSESKVIGARARYGVAQKQLISNHDVKPCPFHEPFLENAGNKM